MQSWQRRWNTRRSSRDTGDKKRTEVAEGEPEGTERVRVGGEDATLIVWAPDYDGGGKAWVRFADGRDAIVGGSRVERG